MELSQRACIRQRIQVSIKKETAALIIGIILLIISIFSLELYLDRTLESQTDTDVSSELILAKLLAEEGRIITPNWYYSTELRVFNTNLVFAPLFRFFHNWHKVRLLGTVLLHFSIILSVFVLCRSLKIFSLFPVISLMLLTPFSDGYYQYVLRFPYYIPHIVITVLSFSMCVFYMRMGKSKKTGKRMLLLANGSLSLLAGLGGARQIIVCYIPLFLSVFVPSFFNKMKTNGAEADDRTKHFLKISAVCLAGGLAGYCVNTRILSEIYHFQIHEVSFALFDLNRMVAAISGFFLSFGYTDGPLNGRTVFRNFASVFLFVCSLYSAVKGIRNRQEKSGAYYHLSCFYISSIIVYILLYSFTDTVYADRYNIPVIILAFPMIAMGLTCLADYKRAFRMLMLVIWIGLTVFSGYDVLKNTGIEEDKTDHQKIADFLVENGYNSGYATFWNSNILTELSNGIIEAYDRIGPLDLVDGDIDKNYKWLQLVKHDTQPPVGKVFLLYSDDEAKLNKDPRTTSFRRLWKLREERIVFVQGNYTVYGYDSYHDLVSDIYDYDFDFHDGNWVVNGEDYQGVRILKEAGVSYGPYIGFREGRYRVTVHGEGLLRGAYQCLYNAGENEIDIETVSAGDREVVYEFTVMQRCSNGEVLIRNTSSEEIQIYSEQIDYLGPIEN